MRATVSRVISDSELLGLIVFVCASACTSLWFGKYVPCKIFALFESRMDVACSVVYRTLDVVTCRACLLNFLSWFQPLPRSSFTLSAPTNLATTSHPKVKRKFYLRCRTWVPMRSMEKGGLLAHVVSFLVR